MTKTAVAPRESTAGDSDLGAAVAGHGSAPVAAAGLIAGSWPDQPDALRHSPGPGRCRRHVDRDLASTDGSARR
jgi:hypothetical protein